MKRRHLLQSLQTSAIATGTATTLIACGKTTSSSAPGAISQPKIRWRMATSWPKSLDTIFGGADTLCKRVAALTDGRFTITPFAAGELVPGLQVLDAVQAGTVECGHTASYYYIGKNPALGFATSMPFGLNAQQQNAWLYQGGGLDLIHKVYGDFNVINFPAGNTGTQMGGWFKREVKTLADLKGLKMRIPGLGGEVMNRLGVNVQVLPGGEIYLALDRGAIDAAEWVGPYDDEKLGLPKAAKYYYYPGWWEPGPTLDALVNLKAWAKLPPSYQAAFQTAAMEANLNMLAQYEALNKAALQRLLAGGTQVVAYSEEILQAAQKEAFAFYEENAASNASFKAVYEPWKSFREEIFQWDRLNSFSYDRFVFG